MRNAPHSTALPLKKLKSTPKQQSSWNDFISDEEFLKSFNTQLFPPPPKPSTNPLQSSHPKKLARHFLQHSKGTKPRWCLKRSLHSSNQSNNHQNFKTIRTLNEKPGSLSRRAPFDNWRKSSSVPSTQSTKPFRKS